MQTVLTVLAAYCLGSVSFAVVVSRALRLPDPRTYGSKNPGATNVLRTGRRVAAVLTLAGDGGKGWLAVWLAELVAPGSASLAGLGAAAFATCFTALLLGLDVAAAAVLVMSALLAWRHRENIVRLAAGTEARLGEKKP